MNLDIGDHETRDGIDWIRTRRGTSGCAVYGPYERLEPGRYVAKFTIRCGEECSDGVDRLCGYVDAVCDLGNTHLASAPLFTSQLRDAAPVTLLFDIAGSSEVEYRVHVNGQIPLLIADVASAHAASDQDGSSPVPPAPFIVTQPQMLRTMYDLGLEISVETDRLIVKKDNVRFHARIYDDVNFVNEVLFQGAYNLSLGKPTCIIDVGMNVGLSSLLFASKDFVKEVHAFEPFVETYERALANIALNPSLANKIKTHNFGLSDHDEIVSLRMRDTGDSGMLSTIPTSTEGTPMRIDLRSADSILRPIVESARARGLEVIAKVDCEGSEFPVFQSLERSGLLTEIRGFMVEWHEFFGNQKTLIDPLLQRNYVVFDVSPPKGNGFFYAVRIDD